VYVVLVPWFARQEPPLRRSLVRGALVALVAYAGVSGALANPVGYARRVAFLLGPASQDWAGYPRGIHGTLAMVGDAVARIPEFTSWPIALAAFVGIVLCLTRPCPKRWRTMLPLVTAVSFSLLFNLGARRTDVRFLLPQSVFFFPYAAVTFDAWWRSLLPGRRTLVVAASMVALAPAILGVASLDATLLTDARYEAERFLEALPSGTRVELYGGIIFLPRVPERLGAIRPGVDPVSARQRIPGVAELVVPTLDPRPRQPDVVVLATELTAIEGDVSSASPYRTVHEQAPASLALLDGLRDGSFGYHRALRATCSLPWPLACVKIHGSTGGESWIYVRTR
jgi:hypothetical protein